MQDPPLRRPKKLIVCCDGTWMNSDIGWTKGGLFGGGHPQNPSNVTRIARALKPEDGKGHVQVVYYQNGIGTSWSAADKFLGGGLAFGLSENIREAYGFMANNYQGDEKDHSISDQLYFVGFSRGAYTARSVAGMIGCLGLLTKAAMSYFYAIFDDFENAGKADYEVKLGNFCKEFKALKFSESPKDVNKYLAAYKKALHDLGMTRIVNVKAIGVFDTVGSLGVPIQPWLQKLGLPTTLHTYSFFDTGIGDYVENAFQVLALDEHRSAFGPTVWAKADGGKTYLKQIWMPGVHTNAGGGADDNAQSDIALAWMMDQLSGMDSEGKPLLEFNPEYIKTEVKATKDDYTNQLKKTWQWGLGQLGNSFVFPTSMAGSVTRTPLNYECTNYETGKSTGTKLINTGEMIHSCVRLRSKLGTTYDGKPYKSKALASWEPTNKDGRFAWVAKDGKRLEEDIIGPFERELLDNDGPAARFVETNE